MRVIRDFRELREPLQASVVTVGNFDGVHLAHQELMREVVRGAGSLGVTSAALTFDPHPTRVLAPERAPRLLTPLEQKVRLIEGLGIELLVVLPFAPELAALLPAEFVHEIIAGQLRARLVRVGPDFRFGRRQAGNVALLGELARQEGFRLEVSPVLEFRGERVSSSRIREELVAGRVHRAGRLLGRPFSVCGEIVEGLGIGARQTVPTLNLAPYKEQLPRQGVYVTRTRLGEQWHESVTNVGHKPTFGEHRLTVESFLLNVGGAISAREMEIEFLHRLRDEMKFPDAAALKAQIQRDAHRSLQFFRFLHLFKTIAPQRAQRTQR
ncbi:MAG TPA: bifunctional riboflavin kinase/FAD synthetase [Terriglobia bacterium]|nr:bifunctional riboflavin kinase/FAD synthetase [Terriglobia bacterium]